MQTYAERAQTTTATMPVATAAIIPAIIPLDARARARRAPRVAERERARGNMDWRDLAQSLAYDAAEMPIVPRLLAGQALLALGFVGLRGVVRLRRRHREREREHQHEPTHRLHARLLGGLAATVGIAFAGTALALISRTRAVPALTAFFAYGHALRQYFPPRLPLTRAA